MPSSLNSRRASAAIILPPVRGTLPSPAADLDVAALDRRAAVHGRHFTTRHARYLLRFARLALGGVRA